MEKTETDWKSSNDFQNTGVEGYHKFLKCRYVNKCKYLMTQLPTNKNCSGEKFLDPDWTNRKIARFCWVSALHFVRLRRRYFEQNFQTQRSLVHRLPILKFSK